LLDACLRRRNFLVHAFFRDRAVAFAHPAGRRQMIEEIERDHELFASADAAVQGAVEPIIPKMGIGPDKLRPEIDRIVREEVLGASAAFEGPTWVAMRDLTELRHYHYKLEHRRRSR
jgi:hypothetical protein